VFVKGQHIEKVFALRAVEPIIVAVARIDVDQEKEPFFHRALDGLTGLMLKGLSVND